MDTTFGLSQAYRSSMMPHLGTSAFAVGTPSSVRPDLSIRVLVGRAAKKRLDLWQGDLSWQVDWLQRFQTFLNQPVEPRPGNRMPAVGIILC